MEYEQIKAAVKEVMDERMQKFYIEREKHYQHHQFMEGFIVWTSSIKSTTLKTVIGLFVTALVGFLVLGFIVWGKRNIG